MNGSISGPSHRVVSVTFRAEAVRALCAGIQETAFVTFAILIAVKHFSSGPGVKATLIGSLALGLLGGLFVVPLIAKLRWKVSHAAGVVQLISMAGFIVASVGAKSEWVYLLGMCVGMGIVPIGIPLQTQYLRENFPDTKRGRLFSASMILRALSTMVFSYLLGSWLDQDMGRFPLVLLVFAAASGVSAVFQFTIPSRPFDEEVKSPPVRQSIRWLREDVVFARMIQVAMVMGLGVLTANSLRVDYLVNPEYEMGMSAKTAALITGVIPAVSRLMSSFFWGWLFDRMNFFRLRALVNLVFLSGILLYFMTADLVLIATGSALFGLARGGGEILWNLWVTKLAPPGQSAGYMAVHTFMTGIRVAITPFLGFYLARYAGIPVMLALCIGFIVGSLILLWPLVFPGEKNHLDSADHNL